MRWRTGPLLPLLLVLLLSVIPEAPVSGQGGTDAPKLDPATVDAIVHTTLREVILRGAPIYNSGEFASCHHLYEGALMALKPLLAYRPALQKEIEGALIIAARTEEVQKRAWVLREVINKVRDEIKPMPGDVSGTRPKTGTITGTVTFDGKPLPKAKITMLAPRVGVKVVLANAEGKFQAEGLNAGIYKVMITTDEPGVKLNPVYESLDTSPLTVEVADKPVTVTFDLKSSGASGATEGKPEALKEQPVEVKGSRTGVNVSGRVTLRGQPLAGGRVTFYPGTGTAFTCAIDNGNYAIENVPEGTYKVVLNHSVGGVEMLAPRFSTVTGSMLKITVTGPESIHDFALQ